MSRPAGTFELWRQDDHGHRFLIGRCPNRAAAERRLAELSGSQHKQVYWITPVTAEDGKRGDG